MTGMKGVQPVDFMGLMAGDCVPLGVRRLVIIQGHWKTDRPIVATRILTKTYGNRYYPDHAQTPH